MAKTLLERALADSPVRKAKNYPPQEIELVLAWLTGKVTALQITRLLNLTAGNTAVWCSYRVKAAYEQGLIKVGK